MKRTLNFSDLTLILCTNLFLLLMIFNYSLAKLREFTIDQEEGASHDQAAVTSSCAQTVISAIPPQEVQRLIQEVSSLDEETLKVKKKRRKSHKLN